MASFFQKNKYIFIVLLVVFTLRIPSLFEPYWYGDEGVYLALGLGIKHGLLLYKEIFDNKTPLIYLLAAIADGRMVFFRLLLDLSVLSTIYFFYRLAKNISGSEKTAIASAIALSCLTTFRFIEGTIANAEIFILLPTTLGLFLISKHLFSDDKSDLSVRQIFLTGIVFGLGFLLKVPAIFDFLAVILFLVLFKKRNLLRIGKIEMPFNIGKFEITLSFGYLVPILITGLFFLGRGAFSEFFSACFLQTAGYLSSWKTGSHSFSFVSLLKSGLVLNGLAVFLLLIPIWLKRTKISPTTIFLAIWFLFSLFAATLSGRPYPHYLIQVVLPFSLGIGLLASKQKKAFYLMYLAMVFLLVFVFIRYNFWYYPTLSYYKNFIEFTLGKKDKTQYFSYFNPNLPEIYQMAEFVSSNTKPSDKIFVWSDEVYIYPLARRLPALRFVVAYHIIEQNAFLDVYKKLASSPPEIIIIDQKLKRFSYLEEILQNSYFKINSFNNFSVFRKREL